MADVMKVAAELCEKDSRTEQTYYGDLLPCRKISPLEPFIKLEEYFMLERDTGKYLLYMAAIERATKDILNSSNITNRLKCLVLGPGLGRLVTFCIEAGKRSEVDVSVHVLEANPVAVEFLRKSFDKEINEKVVHLYEPFTFHPKLRNCDLPSDLQGHCGSFDIITSELLGCFGDDEFLPELTSTLYKMFRKPDSGIMIPDTWTNYLVPVSCPTTFNYLTTSKKSLNAGYTMGLPNDCVFLSNTKAAWTGDCKNLDMEYSCDLDFSLDLKGWISADSLENNLMVTSFSCETLSKASNNQSQLEDLSANIGCDSNINSVRLEDLSANTASCHSKIDSLQSEQGSGGHLPYDSESRCQEHAKINEQTHDVINDTESGMGHRTDDNTYIHGFIGYFTSVLYKDIIIDTRHTSGHRNSFHWECYFVPLSKPVLVKPDMRVKLRMKRYCEEHLKEAVCSGLKLWYEWQVLIGQKNGLDFFNVSEHKPECEHQKAKFNTKPAKSDSLYQEELSAPKTSKDFGLEDSSEEDSFKERCRQCTMHNFSVQNRNGEFDAVFLTWDKT